MAALAAGLFHQMDLAQLHPLVHGLAHIVDGQQGRGNAGQSLHLHAGDTGGLDGAEGFHGLPLRQEPEIHAHLGQGQRMTEGDQLAGALGGHDAGDAGDAQHIAFLDGAALHSGKGLRVHGDDAVGHSLPEGDGLFAHVHHHGVAGGIEMGQIGFSHDRIFLLNKNKSYWKPGLPSQSRFARQPPQRGSRWQTGQL